MSSFARSTSAITALTLLGLILGFGANLAIAATFGVSPDMDAYLAATTLPALICLILATSIDAIVLPLFLKYRQQNTEDLWGIMSALTLGTAAVCLLLGGVGFLFSKPLTILVTPGLSSAQTEHTVHLLRWLWPTLLLTGVNQILSGIHYGNGKLFTPLIIRVLSPTLTLAFVVVFAKSIGVTSLVMASVTALTLQTMLLLFALVREKGLRLRLRPNWRHPAVAEFVRLAVPLMLAMCIYKLRPVYERWLASGMGTGAISTLGYATRLTSVIQPLLISGIAVSGFALMSGLTARKDMEALRKTIIRSCNALFFASVPLAVLLCGFAHPVIGLMLQRGAFTAHDTVETSRLFALYALALPAGAVGTVVGQAFYASQETRIPILAGILDIALFVTLATLLAPHWGLLALPVSFLCSLYLTAILVTYLLPRKTGFPVLPLFLRPFLQGLVASLVSLGIGLLLQSTLPKSYLYSAACLAVGGILYLLIQHLAFKSPETRRAIQMLRGG